jgi:hypothetical protein
VIRRGAVPAVALTLVVVVAAITELDVAVSTAGPQAVQTYRLRLAALQQQAGHRCETASRSLVRGELFEQPLADGLVFRLVPDTYGWTIAVIDGRHPTEDYVAVATPPFRGINHRFLEGWHFRNQANTGPNQGDVNAPQREREFGFVLTPADYEQASKALDTLLWGAHPEAEREQARATLDAASRGHGTLRITGMTLGNLVAGAQAWFETLEFDAELCRAP